VGICKLGAGIGGQLLTAAELVERLKVVDGEYWLTSESDSGQILWLPLLQISSSGLWLGLDDDGEWILGRLNGRVVSSPNGDSSPWVTILDMTEEDFRERLTIAANRFNLPPTVLQEKIPVDNILVMAIKSGSRHWAECAAVWLRKRSTWDVDVDLIRELSEARWASQRTRQIANQLLRHRNL
jgi:hypothetical protein